METVSVASHSIVEPSATTYHVWYTDKNGETVELDKVFRRFRDAYIYIKGERAGYTAKFASLEVIRQQNKNAFSKLKYPCAEIETKRGKTAYIVDDEALKRYQFLVKRREELIEKGIITK